MHKGPLNRRSLNRQPWARDMAVADMTAVLHAINHEVRLASEKLQAGGMNLPEAVAKCQRTADEVAPGHRGWAKLPPVKEALERLTNPKAVCPNCHAELVCPLCGFDGRQK